MKTILLITATAALLSIAGANAASAASYAWAETMDRHPDYYAPCGRYLLFVSDDTIGPANVRARHQDEITPHYQLIGNLLIPETALAAPADSARLPEPAAALLFGAALIAIGRFGRRSLKKKGRVFVYRV